MKFTKATKKQARLRMGIIGPSGSGKSYSMLAIGTSLGKLAVLDSERCSASKYADKFNFDVLELDNFNPKNYIEAIRVAEGEGYEVIGIDSLSHAWMGVGGVLEIADNVAKRSQSKNSFNAWKEASPQHHALVDAILRSSCHVIATMRSKTEYVIEKDDRGKNTPRKIGTQPVQRDGMEYEFDVVADMDLENNLIIGKTRCSELTGKTFHRPGEEVANVLKSWLSDGSPSLFLEISQEMAQVKTKDEKDTIGGKIKSNIGSLSELEVTELRRLFHALVVE